MATSYNITNNTQTMQLANSTVTLYHKQHKIDRQELYESTSSQVTTSNAIPNHLSDR